MRVTWLPFGDSILSDRADIFDPTADSWAEAAPLGSVRASHTAQLLADGRVLIAGGAELYDPAADAWTAAANLAGPRYFYDLVLLKPSQPVP